MFKFGHVKYNDIVVKGSSNGHTGTNIFAKKCFIRRTMGSTRSNLWVGFDVWFLKFMLSMISLGGLAMLWCHICLLS